MKRVSFAIGEFVIFVIILFAFMIGMNSLARGAPQWGTGNCAVPQFAAPANPPARAVEWHFREDSPDEAYLYVDGVQVGALRSDFTWLPIVGDAWGNETHLFLAGKRRSSADDARPYCSCKTCECDPCLCVSPAEAEKPPARAVSHGMDWRPEPNGRERFSCSGSECPREMVLKLLGKDDRLPDDSTYPYVTVIADASTLKDVQVAFDTHPLLLQWKSKVRLKLYTPDNWAAKPLQPEGPLTISFQSAEGKELSRMTDFQDGPVRMAKTLEAVGKLRDPKPFDPKKTPDLSKQGHGPLVNAGEWFVEHWWLIVVGVGVLCVVVFNKNKVKA